MKSLTRRKPYLLVAAGLLGLLVGLGALFWRAERRNATATALEDAVLTLSEEANFDRQQLENGIHKMADNARLFAALPAVVDAGSDGGRDAVKLRLQQVFVAAIQHGDDLARLSFTAVAEGGRELLCVDRNPADRLLRVTPENERKATVTDRDMQRALALSPDEILLSLAQGDQADDPTRTAPPTQLRFLKPVRNGAGNVTGILAMDGDLGPILTRLGAPLSTPGAIRHGTYLTDHQGRYLLRPNQLATSITWDQAKMPKWEDDFTPADDLVAGLGRPLPSGIQALTARDGSIWLARMDEIYLGGAASSDTLRLWQIIPLAFVQKGIGAILADRLKLGAAMGGLLVAGLGVLATLLFITSRRTQATRDPVPQLGSGVEQRGALQAGVLATLMGLLAGGTALFLLGQMDAELARSQAESAATIAIERVVDALDDSEHVVQALRQLPLRDITTQEEFARRIAPLAGKAGPGVTLQWSPKGVVRYIFPLAGNEPAIGHDLRADARIWKLLHKSIQSGQAHWDGPFELRQGGVGMVLRMPVYRDGVPATEASFEGVATSLVNVSLLMRRLVAERPEHELGVWIANGAGPMTRVWGRADQPPGESRTRRVLTSISSMGLGVEVAAWPREATSGWRSLSQALGLGLAAGLLGALAFALESWRSGLRALGKESLNNQLLLQTASDGIHILDEQGNVQRVSDSFARLLGYPRDEIKDLNIQDWDPGATPNAFRQLLARLAGKPEGVRYESRYLCRDGSLIEVEISSRLVNIDGKTLFCGATRDVTERKQAEAALRRSEEQFRTLVEFAPSGKVMVNAEGRICMVNAQLERDSGYTRHELLGQSVDVLVPVRHLHTYAAHRQSYAESPKPRLMGAKLELHVRRKDGSEFPADIALTNIETSQGRLVVTSIRDITPRKAAEAALRAAQQRNELALAAAKVGIWEWNLATDQVRWDNRMFELYGLPPSADGHVDFAVWRKAVLPEELAAQLAQVQAVASGQLPKGKREFRIRRICDGRIRHLESVETLLRDPAGRPEWVLGTNSDITELREADAVRIRHMRTLECVDKLNAAFRRVSSREGTLEVALDEIASMLHCETAFLLAPSDPSAGEWGVTTHSNPDRTRRRPLQGLRVAMTPAAAAVFSQIHAAIEPIAFGPAEPAPVPTPLAEALGGKGGLAISLRIQGASPWILWLKEDGASGLWDAEARWLLTAIARRMEDVLAVWSSAQEILRLNAELEQRVDARSMELEVTNEILRRSNQDLAQFASIASHDLKSPLRAIDTLAAWISEDLGDGQSQAIRDNLRLMRQRVRRTERLLDDLLAYSRAGKVKDVVKLVQVSEMIDEITALIEVPLAFRVRLLGDPEPFTTAATPLRTVLQNLINNAVKHHDRKAGNIEISVHERGNFYEFRVDDDGPGIPPEHHERIWGMFQTLQPRDKVEGSGIGLALIRRLVQYYGGIVGIENRLPRGARFFFTWPKTISIENGAG